MTDSLLGTQFFEGPTFARAYIAFSFEVKGRKQEQCQGIKFRFIATFAMKI